MHKVEESIEVAIIGVSLRFPKSNTLDEFWTHLISEKSLITEIPLERWDKKDFFGDPQKEANKTNSIWGGFIDHADCFDASFFNISPREAVYMDPQQRIILELAWKAIEDSGYQANSLKASKIGVFMGVCNTDYTELIEKYLQEVDAYVPTGTSNSILSNRISYWFDFKGPSITIDTACASSLSAIHQAVRSLENKECESALAGGVNLCWSPRRFIALSQSGMLSKDGKGKAFDEKADGYVRAEGGAILVLKPLCKAIEEGDHIYAVIKGIGTNHGGRTNSLTVTNPRAQADLITEIYEKAGVSPDTVSYIETHGPGTPLGDPIEIYGLKTAFQQLSQKFGKTLTEATCGLGSVKTNIGHLEAAAGIAGVIKVIAAMQHKMLPASIHFDQLNPVIKLHESPFYIVNKTKPWLMENDNEMTIPRRAGISSFGFGGSNAHIVLEEYIDKKQVEHNPLEIDNIDSPPLLIPLSAKNSDRLLDYAEHFLEYLQKTTVSQVDASIQAVKELDNHSTNSKLDLRDLAYTLQVGREAMDERVIFLVKNIPELIVLLEAFLLRKEKIANCWWGQVKQGKEIINLLTEDEDSQELIYKWITKNRVKKIAELWAKGYTVDWKLLYGEIKPQRISLPTYPFARECFWLPMESQQSSNNLCVPTLHPLLHQNISNFSEQRFSSTFTGNEFFLRDHLVKNQRILPGVAHLEMARAAVALSSGMPTENNIEIRLKDVVWIRPINIEKEPAKIEIGFYPKDNGEIDYQIYSNSTGYDGEPTIYSQGSAVLCPGGEIPTLDLQTLHTQCHRNSFSSSQCYQMFKTMGIDYGPTYQGIERVYLGEDKALAKLSLPAAVSSTKDLFFLHPCIMDSALQASACLTLDSIESAISGNLTFLKPFLAFSLQEMQIFGKSASSMWAFIRYSKDYNAIDKVQKIDIDLCDDHGTILVRMKGFFLRAWEGDFKSGNLSLSVPDQTSDDLFAGTDMLLPVWDTFCVEKGPQFPSSAERVVIIGGTEANRNMLRQQFPNHLFLEMQSEDTIETIAQRLETVDPIQHIIWIATSHSLKFAVDEVVIKDQTQGVLQIFRIIKALLQLGYGTKDLGWSIITIQAQAIHRNDSINPTHASVHGLIGSVAKEYPNWKMRLIDLELNCNWPMADIFTMLPDPDGNLVVYRNQEWHRQKLIPLRSNQPEKTLYKNKGVYVVVGGAGGIGEVWSEYMIRIYQAQIVWIGRRLKDKTIQAKLDKLGALGSPPQYIVADATDRKALLQAYEVIKQQYTQINGVIHSAVGMLDQSLVNMEEDRFCAGLSAKVDISVRIAQIFQKEPLDFILFFSSTVAFTKDHGKSSYASGCAFTDAFAHQIALECPCAVKVMNWGYWGSVGIGDAVPEVFKNRLMQMGIGTIEPAIAMEVLEAFLVGTMNQMVFLKTTKPLVMEEVDLGESVTVYPDCLESGVRNIQLALNKNNRSAKAQHIKLRIGQSMKDMDALLSKLLWGQLQSSGLFTEKEIPIAKFITNNRICDLYRQWLEASLAILTRDKYLDYNETSYTVIDTTRIDMQTLWNEWERKKSIWLEDPDLKAKVLLVETTMRSLPEILCGKVAATDVIFPNSSMELVEGIYKNNPIANYFNEMLADALVTYVGVRLKQDPLTKIRIVEIGAGTGGTSTVVFQKLKPFRDHIQEYCYTDVSKAFLNHAEKEYGSENPYLTYKIFNIGLPIAGQDISAGEYDIAIAANVLHATRNIRQTLWNVKAVLKKQGMLFLNELSDNWLFNHLTFGLLEGWWLYEDSALRVSGCPALSPDAWRKVLQSEGFPSVVLPMPESHNLGQSIVIAESDGVVRQKQLVNLNLVPVKNNVITPVSQNGLSQPKPLQIHASESVADILYEKSIAYFRKLIGEVLRIPGHKVDIAVPLETYGIDSILIMQLNNALRKVFTNISSTLFFEYQTIDALVGYFIQTHQNSLIKILGIEDQGLDNKNLVDPEISVAQPMVNTNLIFAKSRYVQQIHHLGKYVSKTPSVREPIAIIGITGRYPQAANLNEFWNNLESGRECITEIPTERWSLEGFFDSDRQEAINQGKSYSKWGGFIEGFADFDPLFFNISPREAMAIDPQERLFIQSCWEVFEDAGYTREHLAMQYQNRVGVFAGITKIGFNLLGPDLWKQGEYLYPRTSFGSVANRISYLMNLKGPSMPIDTMCSSSLTAIHEACEHLYRGECEMAIAGGVNLYLHSSSFIELCGVQMLSEDGRCRSFGKGANGFVPGEGVGVILLKRLSQAVTDQDHIYAVIRGTSINHGGKTNGYTVPNPLAQEELIQTALAQAGVNARSVSYIEAHGTGTELGDPIEITGLTQAFHKDTQDTEFCAIGSVKSNIGHLEAASGIAGFSKIILQMKYHKIVPSLHTEDLNPNIEFAKTPFKVQSNLVEWKRPVITMDGETREYPRIAGISSFGAGGSNAHVVIEEYIPKDFEKSQVTINSLNPAVVVLSAKNANQLKSQAQQLLDVIEKQQFTDIDLADIAFTLQVGREAMEERLAIISCSIKGLQEKLQLFVEGQDGIEDLYRGQVKRNKETLAVFAADEDLQKAMDAWIIKRKYGKLLDLWVKGLIVDWNKIYGNVKPHRISLPTYPFAKESYWIPEHYGASNINTSIRSNSITTGFALSHTLHPVLHQNTSNLSGQRLSSTFTGQEFFLANHIVNGQCILPGVVYLEMARAAIAESLDGPVLEALKKGKTRILLRNVVWVQPIVVGDAPVNIHIGLFPEDDGEIAYEIYNESNVDNEDYEAIIIYSQGKALLKSEIEFPVLNLSDIQCQCNQMVLSSTQCYEAFRFLGIDYGPGHQGIEKVYVGLDKVLAKISLPTKVNDTSEQFVLHPSIMDSALQASIGFMIKECGDIVSRENLVSLKPLLPFALDQIEILGKCPDTMWALIKLKGNHHAGAKIQKLDIDLCNEQGMVCVRMKGLSLRILDGEFSSPTEDFGTLMLAPCLIEQAIYRNVNAPYLNRRVVIFCEPGKLSLKNITTQMDGVHCLILQSEKKGLAERYQSYALQVFDKIQSILNDKSNAQTFIQLVVPTQNEQQLFSGLSGLLKTAQLENPKLIGQVIEMDLTADSSPAYAQEIVAKLQENLRVPFTSLIRYQDGKRWVTHWSEVEGTHMANIPWRDKGVYLITGGMGSLGFLFAKEIVSRANEVTLILTGRSPLNSEKQNQLGSLKMAGAAIEYRQVDITDKKAVISLIQSIRNEFGHLHGAIHSAGVIRDNYIIKKASDEFLEVLAPKVSGLVNLDEATAELNLDFFICFSSGAGAIGNPGQADYAAANAFMDAYAKYRNALVGLNKRQGQTLSIDWPLWKEGGMRVDEITAQIMKQNLGMVAMQTSSGIQAFYQSLVTENSQMMIIEGKLPLLRQKFLKPLPMVEAPVTSTFHSQTTADAGSLLDKAQATLKEATAKLMGVRVADIDMDLVLNEFGFDAVKLTELANILNDKYLLNLSSSIFSEHQTIHSIAKHLVAEEQNRLGKQFQAENQNIVLPLKGKTISNIAQDVLLERTIHYLKRLLSSVINLPVQRIEADIQMEKYGIDSILIMKLTNQLEKVFGTLSKTLFFEYQNIQDLAGYFLESYGEQLTEILGLKENIDTTQSKPQENAIMMESVKSTLTFQRRSRFIPRDHQSPSKNAEKGSDIAIIGVAGRYPRAKNIHQFWSNLRDSIECITEIPNDRWEISRYFNEDKNKPGKTYSKWGGFLDGVDQFDPLFFNISPREAVMMDPQERLFLECVYETLEDAGYTRETLGKYQGSGLDGNVGVYVGVMYEEYQLYGAQQQLLGQPVALAGNPSSIANRVSYFCNFHGPCMAIDSMCSSSLTAIHLACQSLQRGGCELAIAGGVNLSIHPNKYLMLAQGKFISSKGRCESFGQGGDGYVPGEGVGAILLKSLSKAIADGDQIYGIIKATAINHGGKTNGYSVPNPNAQAAVIKRAIQDAGVHPRMISYIEAHGTGTSLGDPIEIAGLNKTFQEYTKDKQFCAIGSAKSNIGHCESAAGIAGVTKVLMQLKHRQLVPSLHSKVLNPNIDFRNTPFVVQQELAEWKQPVIEINGETKTYARIAGISSFGAGGSNAHIIIEEYIPNDSGQPKVAFPPKGPAIILLSAKNEERLKEQVKQLWEEIRERKFSNANLADLAYTLQVGREAMEERLAILVGSVQELEYKLKCFSEGQDDIEDLYHGQIKQNREALAAFTADDELQEAIQKWIQRGKYLKLLDLWVKGLSFDWNKIYEDIQPEARPRRISLPTYPFAREKYWIPKMEGVSFKTTQAAPSSSSADYAFQPVFVSEAGFTGISGKPKEISLQPLPIEVSTTRKSIEQSQQSVAVSTEDISVSITKSVSKNDTQVNASHDHQPGLSLELLQKELVTSLAESLFMKQTDVDMDKKFVDMGLDSIIGVEWIRMINKKFKTAITATKVYDYPTIREFAKFLEKDLNKRGIGLNQFHDNQVGALSIDDVVHRVQQGTLDVGQAQHLLNKILS